MSRHFSALVVLTLLVFGGAFAFANSQFFATVYERAASAAKEPPWPAPLDVATYNARMLALAHYEAPAVASSSAAASPLAVSSTTAAASSTAPRGPVFTATTSVSLPGRLWPTAAAYPAGGALLPFKRIVAYYGNFYSTKMGVLGEYQPEEVLAKLASTTALWDSVDPATPAVPAIQYIAVVAQAAAGKDGRYRVRMPDEEIDKALSMANAIHGLLILDVQVGKSTLAAELPGLEKYLMLPNVELAVDPEFSMKYDEAPGTVIGTFDAANINYAAAFLANLVRAKRLAPKVLVVHRFTKDMVTNYRDITPLPEVEIVMDMDGWGDPARKFGTYNRVIAPEPVQFTGVKLFYHADLRPPSTRMLIPEEVLSLTPAPIYIQYQ